jgi:serine/threonine-protein kinase
MDIYSAGMVVYELLAGRHPFEDRKTSEEIILAHLHDAPAAIVERPALHPKLEALVLQMLAKDPQRRPQSAQDVLNRLARLKTEWMQQSSDGSTGESLEFQFDADVGERWPTDMGDDFSIGSESERAPVGTPASAALLDGSELAGVPPLAFQSSDETGKRPAQTGSTWWTRTDGDRTRIRVDHVLLSAAAFASLTGVAAWFWFRSASEAPAARGSSSPASPPLTAAPAQPIVSAAPTEPRPDPMLSPAVGASSQASESPNVLDHPAPFPPSENVQLPDASSHGPKRRPPALAKTPVVRQSPTPNLAPAKKIPSGAGDDPMQP